MVSHPHSLCDCSFCGKIFMLKLEANTHCPISNLGSYQAIVCNYCSLGHFFSDCVGCALFENSMKKTTKTTTYLRRLLPKKWDAKRTKHHQCSIKTKIISCLARLKVKYNIHLGYLRIKLRCTATIWKGFEWLKITSQYKMVWASFFKWGLQFFVWFFASDWKTTIRS